MFRPMASPSFSSRLTNDFSSSSNLKTSFQQKVVPQLCQHCPDSSLLPLYTQSIQFLQILVSTLSLPPRFLCFVYKTSRVSTSIYLGESMALQIGIFFAFSRDFHYFHKCFDYVIKCFSCFLPPVSSSAVLSPLEKGRWRPPD